MEIGVRELKQQLSKYLDHVAGGGEIVVTDRGHPKARIVPIAAPDALAIGIEQGWIRPPQRGDRAVSTRRVPGARRVMDVLDEDRGE